MIRRAVYSASVFVCVAFFAVCSHAADVDRSLIPAMSAEKLFGYIDADSLSFTIPPQFTAASFFVDGIARVHIPEKGLGLIDRSGKVLLDGCSKITPAYMDGKLHPNYFD